MAVAKKSSTKKGVTTKGSAGAKKVTPKKTVKVTKSTAKSSKATVAAAKKAVANASSKKKQQQAGKDTPSAKAKTPASVNGRVVLKVTSAKNMRMKAIVFPGQQPPANTSKAGKAPPAAKTTKIVTQKQKQKQTPVSAPRSVLKAAAPAKKTARSATATAGAGVHTAEAIARDITHPKREEVSELLKAYGRGWISASKFNEVLQKSLF